MDSLEIEIGDIDNLSLKAFLDYWNSLRGERYAPSWKDFDLMALGPNLIPYTTVVDVLLDPLDFVFRFWGTAHRNSMGIEKTGKSILEQPWYRDREPFDEFSKVMNERCPLLIQAILTISGQNWKKIPVTVLRLPLSDDGKEVDQIISCEIWER